MSRIEHLERLEAHYQAQMRDCAERAAQFSELEQQLNHAKDNLVLLPVDKHTARARSHILQSLRLVAKLRRAEPKASRASTLTGLSATAPDPDCQEAE